MRCDVQCLEFDGHGYACRAQKALGTLALICADDLEMKIFSKQIDMVKQSCTFESDQQIALKPPIAS